MWASSACWTSDVEPGPVVVAGDVGVFCLGCLPLGSLWCLMLWFLRNVARNSPTCISNVEITSLEFCGFLDTYEKLGYPNYVRVLVDEAPKANSCVRSSSHDTVHNPRDASNTTPTPHNAKSRLISAAVGVPPCGRDSHSRAPDRHIANIEPWDHLKTKFAVKS